LQHRNLALISFMLDTGVRVSEVASLTLEDVDVRGMVARVQGKGDRERLVYFQEGTAELVRRWLTIRGEESGRLFWLSAAGIRVMLQRIRRETGLNLLHAHQIRHTSFTMMVRAKMPLPLVQRIAGHEKITTTQAYLALVDDDVREHHATASPFERVRERLEPKTAKNERKLRAG
jgi:site-specific recombinase XerD